MKAIKSSRGDNALMVRKLLDQAGQAENSEDDADDDEAGEDDGDAEESVEDALGGLGDFFRVAGAVNVAPGGLEETKKKNGTGKKENESDNVGHTQEFANIHAGSNLPAGGG